MKYTIPVTYERCGNVEVEASSLEEAYRIVTHDHGDIGLPHDSEYVDGSFGPSYDIEDYRDLHPGVK